MFGPYKILYLDELKPGDIELNVPVYAGAVQTGVSFPTYKEPLLVHIEPPEIHISRPKEEELRIDRVTNDASFSKETERNAVLGRPVGTMVLRKAAETGREWHVDAKEELVVVDELGLRNFLGKIAEFAYLKQQRTQSAQ